MLPSLDYAKKSLDYIITTNTNNENRLNLYVTLNVGLIGALGFLYRGFTEQGLAGQLILGLAGLSLASMGVGLALALNISKSRVYDPESRMITRWIANVEQKKLDSEKAGTLVWIYRHMQPQPPIDAGKYLEFQRRVEDERASDPDWEVKMMLRETYALANVVRDRAIGVKYVREVFTASIILTSLTIFLDIVARANWPSTVLGWIAALT